MSDDPVLDKRLEHAGLPPMGSKPELFTLGAGFKFGFGFAAGVCVFMILASIIGWMLVGTAVMSAMNSFHNNLLIPNFH